MNTGCCGYGWVSPQFGSVVIACEPAHFVSRMDSYFVLHDGFFFNDWSESENEVYPQQRHSYNYQMNQSGYILFKILEINHPIELTIINHTMNEMNHD